MIDIDANNPPEVLFDALVIEDEPDSRELLRRVLQHGQVKATLVSSAQEALEALTSFIPDVLIVDLALPEMTGIEFLEAVRRNPDLQHIPAVAVTAFSQESDFSEDHARAIGFEGYLEKPIDALTFAQRVQRYVRLESMRGRANPCWVCSRTDNPLLDVVTSAEARILADREVAEGLIRQTIYDGRIASKSSGRAWLLRYIEVAAKWGEARLPPFRYWEVPEIPCPICQRKGDPLDQVIAVTDPLLVEMGSEAVKRVRDAAIRRTIPSRKSEGTWLVIHSRLGAVLVDLDPHSSA